MSHEYQDGNDTLFLKILKDAPLFSKLFLYAKENRVRFHMPAHNALDVFDDQARFALLEMDTTELPCTENLNAPDSTLLEAEKKAAAFYGADQALYLSTGSSVAIKSALCVLCSKRGTLLAPRTIHNSVLQAASLLDLELLPCPSLNLPELLYDLLLTLKEQRNLPKAIFITSPDYMGRLVDLRPFSRLLKGTKTVLIVDAAHGAHLPVMNRETQSMVDVSQSYKEADLVVFSAHKTLPALTPCSILTIYPTLFEKRSCTIEDFRRAAWLFSTSSPSLMLAASLDYALALMRQQGTFLLEDLLKKIQSFEQNLPEPFFLLTSKEKDENKSSLQDPLRIVLAWNASWTGNELGDFLESQGIDIELRLPNACVLIPHFGQADTDFTALIMALRIFAKTHELRTFSLDKQHFFTLADLLPSDQLLQNTQKKIQPFKTLLPLKVIRCSLWEAYSKSYASLDKLAVYPPGLAIVWPSEVPSYESLQLLTFQALHGFVAEGLYSSREEKTQNLTGLNRLIKELLSSDDGAFFQSALPSPQNISDALVQRFSKFVYIDTFLNLE